MPGPRPVQTLLLVIAGCLGLAGALAGCGARAPIGPVPAGSAVVPAGSSAGTINSGGRTRTYRVYRPASLPSGEDVPLVVFLHGGFGDGAQAEQSYGWDQAADRGSFVVVYPDGVGRAWNGGTCCGAPTRQDVDDVGFVRALVARLQAELPIDPTRIYATGISNGGILDYRLACETDIFAAIGPDSATMLVPCTAPSQTSIIAIHGTADNRVPYDGGPGSGVGHVDGPSVPAVIARWQAIDGCAPSTTSASGAVTTSLAGCPDGRAVELVTIDGAGHQWPGGRRSNPIVASLLGLDQPSTAMDATATIWTFFAAHPRS